MSTGAVRFDNIFNRLCSELDRLQRFELSKDEIQTIKSMVLRYRPTTETTPLAAKSTKIPTTPYDIAVNRFEGYKLGHYTWEYFIEQWSQCSPEDQQRLNTLVQGE